MALRDWWRKKRAGLARRAAERSIKAGETALAAAQFAEATARIAGDANLARAIHGLAGDRLLNAGASREAIVHFFAAAELAPTDRENLRQWARASRLAGDAAAETEAWRRLLAGDPDCLDAHERLAELTGGIDAEAAALHFEALAAAFPEEPERWRRLACAHAATGNKDQETDAWRQACALDPADNEAHAHLIELLWKNGQKTQALPYLEALAGAPAHGPAFWNRLAEARAAAGDSAGEITAWREVLTRDESAIEAHRRLADLLEASSAADAIPYLRFLAAGEPEDLMIWRRLGGAYQAAGDLALETEAWRRIVDLTPDDAEAHGRLAEIFLQTGDKRRAAAHLAQWVKQNDQDKSAWKMLAIAREEVGDNAGALDAWRRADALGGLDPEANARAAKLCLSAELHEEAIERLQAILSSRPEDEETLRLLARACQLAGKRSDEIEAWRRVLPIAPTDQRANRRMGDLLYGLDRLIDAAPYLKRAVKYDPQNGRLARRLARALRASGDGAGEIEAWKMAPTLRPDDVEAHRRLGDLFYGLERYAEAIPHLECAINAGPHKLQLARRVAKAHRRIGDVGGEINAWERLIVSAPADTSARRRLAELLRAQGDHLNAVQHLRAAIAVEPANIDMARMLAASCEQLGDTDGELAAHRAVLEIDAGNVSAHKRSGKLLFERQAFSEAARHLRKAAEALPKDVVVRRRLLKCLREVGTPADEAPILRQIAALDDDDIDAHRRLGEIGMAEGATEEALVHWRRCAAAAPQNALYQRALAEALSASPSAQGEVASAWARLLELAPKDLEARRRLADAHFNAARYEDAEPIYKTLAAAEPEDPALWRRWAQTARALRGPSAEAAVLRLAIKKAPDTDEFRYALAGLLVRAGESESVDAMRAAWKAHLDPERHAALCGDLEEAGEIDVAVAEYRRLIKEAAQAPIGWRGLGDFMQRTGQHRLAAMYFGKAYELSGEDSHRSAWMSSLLSCGAFDTLEMNCLALLEAGDSSKDLQFQLAQALAGRRRFEEAHALAQRSYHPADALDREAYLNYLSARAAAKSERRNAAAAPSSANAPSFRDAERCQARGDLRNAARIYRDGGAALRRDFAQTSADGVEVDGPDFIIIGAPSSGASSIRSALALHPRLRIMQRERGYFLAETHLSPAVYAKRLSIVGPPSTAIGAAESGAGDIESTRPLFGEKASDYLTIDDDAIELCAALYPKLRLICALREPVARAWSNLRRRRLAARGADFYLHSNEKPQPWLSPILEFSRYERHLRRWARRFPSKQFLLVDFAQLRANPVGSLNDVQDFLGAGRVDLFPALSSDTDCPSDEAPPPEIESLLAGLCGAEIFDAAALRRILEGQATPGDVSKAA